MALGTPVNVKTGSNSTGAAITTASFTVASGSLIIVAAGGRRSDSTTPDACTISDSETLSWTSLVSSPNTGGSTRARLQVWAAVSTGVAMTVTVTPGASTPNTAFDVQVVSISNGLGTISNTGVDNTNSAGDPAPSLGSAPSSDSAVIGFACMSIPTTFSAPVGFTKLNEVPIANFYLQTIYDTSSPAQSASWNTSGTVSVGALLEILLSPKALTPSLFTNTNTFYSPTLGTPPYEVAAPLVTNAQTFYSPTATVGGVTVAPSLFSNSQTFYAPTAAPGAVTLTPSLFTNTQAFYSPAVGAGLLAPSLFTNSQVFYAPSVTTGAVTLTPNLFTNAQTFFAASVVSINDLRPLLLTNDQIFYDATVTFTIAPSAPRSRVIRVPRIRERTISQGWEARTIAVPPMGRRTVLVPAMAPRVIH